MMCSMSMIIDATHKIMHVLAALPLLMGVGACSQGAVGLYIARRTGDGPGCNKACKYLLGGLLLLAIAVALAMPTSAILFWKAVLGN